MAKVNLDLAGINSANDIVDELKNNVGSSAFSLDHDRFFGGAILLIYTGAGETGVKLVQDTDYSLSGLDSDLTAEAIAQVWSLITVENVTYQTGNLYFTYHAVADEIDAEDFDPDDFITSDGSTVFTAIGAGFKDEDDMASDSAVAVASQQSIKAYADSLHFTPYDTGWINRSDWTDVHMGSNTTKNVDSDVNHGFGVPLSDLLVKVLISTDGTDANSFEILNWNNASTDDIGVNIFQVDNDNFKVQTGASGLAYNRDSDGSGIIIDTEDWYYKIKVYRLV